MKLQTLCCSLAFWMATAIPSIVYSEPTTENAAASEGAGGGEAGAEEGGAEGVSQAGVSEPLKPGRGRCAKVLGWMRRPRFTTKQMLGGTAIVAGGMALYPVVVQDHLKWGVGVYNALLFSDDGPAFDVRSSKQIEAKLGSLARLLRTRQAGRDALELIYYYAARNPDFEARFRKQLGDPEEAMESLIASDNSLVTLPSLRAKRAAFDSLMTEALVAMIKPRELDWGATGIKFQHASELFEEFGRMGKGVKNLREIRAGKPKEDLKESWYVSRALGEAVLQDVLAGTLDQSMADAIIKEISTTHPQDSYGNRIVIIQDEGIERHTSFPDPQASLIALLGKSSFSDSKAFIDSIRNFNNQKIDSVPKYVVFANQQADLQQKLGEIIFYSNLKDKFLTSEE